MPRRFRFHPAALPTVLLAAFVALATGSSASPVSAQETTTIDGGIWEFAPEEGFEAASTGNVVEIQLENPPAQGLGAADISVAFDSTVLRITACDVGDLDGACNPNAPDGPARAAGFKVPALTSDAVIATFTFDCIQSESASSALTITVNELLDGTPGDAQAITATVQNGTVNCETGLGPGLPDTGGDPGDSSGIPTGWIIALLVSLVLVVSGTGGLGVLRLRRRA